MRMGTTLALAAVILIGVVVVGFTLDSGFSRKTHVAVLGEFENTERLEARGNSFRPDDLVKLIRDDGWVATRWQKWRYGRDTTVIAVTYGPKPFTIIRKDGKRIAGTFGLCFSMGKIETSTPITVELPSGPMTVNVPCRTFHALGVFSQTSR